MKKLVIFDRDGTLNIDSGYTHKVADLIWVPGALSTLSKLNHLGAKVAVATNQSGISRGFFTKEQVNLFHTRMTMEAKKAGGNIEKFYICPHQPSDKEEPICPCRKPNPGMLNTAVSEFGVNKEDCIFVGNSSSDKLAAERAGLDFHLANGTNHDFEQLIQRITC
jgi:D-glycero-D-manno-heptose 1,7-bisphosphate phosphatase